MPTGTGKTFTFGALLRELHERAGSRCLVVAHREELISQIRRTLEAFELEVGVVQGSENGIDAPVVVASLASLHAARRAAISVPFDFLVIDEAHHALADNSYGSLVRWAELLASGKGRRLKTLGVTATDYRGDERELSGVFEAVAFRYTIPEAIADGYLAPLRAFSIRTHIELDVGMVRGGDFAQGRLSAVVNTRNTNELVCESYLKHARGASAIAFCVDVAHAKALAEQMRDRKVRAAAVWGSQPKHERREVLRQLRAGELDVVTNCMLLTEGFDYPQLGAVLLCRPTMSRVLFMQQVGRVTRIAPGKTHGTVLDFTYNTSRHGQQARSLSELDVPGLVESMDGFEPSGGRPRTAFVEIRPRGAGLRVFRVTLFDSDHPIAWTEHRKGRKMRRFASTRELGAVLEQAGPNRWVVYLVEMQARRPTVERAIMPDLQSAVELAETRLVESGGLEFASAAAWKANTPSDKQLSACRRWGVTVPSGASSGEVSSLLGLEIATSKIRRWLVSSGIARR